jgi:ABC-type nitrate/sulfonate/bicarbonate transport system permease component
VTAVPTTQRNAALRWRLPKPGFDSMAAVSGVLTAAAIWEIAARASVLPDEIPACSTTIERIWVALGTSKFWTQVGETLSAWAIGLGVAFVIGMLLGILIGSSDVVRDMTDVVIECLRPIPPLVYLPFMLLVLGATPKATVVLVVTAALWPILLQTSYGVRDVDPVMRDVARAYGLTLRQRITAITIPVAAPFVATGVRVSMMMALVVTVGVELLGTGGGLGGEMYLAEERGDYTTLFAYAVSAGLLGVALGTITTRAERSLLGWHQAHRKVEA